MRLTSQRLDRTHPDAGFWLELASWLRPDVTETGEMSTVDALVVSIPMATSSSQFPRVCGINVQDKRMNLTRVTA